MHVEVTAEDIAKGLRGSAGSCPIALAVQRTFNTDQVTVTGVHIHRYYKTYEGGYATPSEASNFIAHFDAGHIVEPFEFDINEATYHVHSH